MLCSPRGTSQERFPPSGAQRAARNGLRCRAEGNSTAPKGSPPGRYALPYGTPAPGTAPSALPGPGARP
ncbi:hypothetical protein GCM10010383_60630 [Streptomyces lomondensis]|uniref:Uncharacterized protein n=1 Tax=Streptomyces lomondensis TaxID=68229 RepID=A0ABQ2XMS6_9ACTN|nr:hypothetical protein GCM10010383_60630 [Streptomyces lomondensis]